MGEVGIHSGPRSWKNGKTGPPGFVTNWIGQMLSPILICRLWTMALWLVLYMASRIAKKYKEYIISAPSTHTVTVEKTVLKECSYHQAICRPSSPNLWYTSAVSLALSITMPGIDCEIESIWSGIRLPSNDPKFQHLNNSSAFPSYSCPVVRNLQSPWKNVYLPKFFHPKMFFVKFLTRDKNDRSRESWSL